MTRAENPNLPGPIFVFSSGPFSGKKGCAVES
jgi:hypothetical protein